MNYGQNYNFWRQILHDSTDCIQIISCLEILQILFIPFNIFCEQTNVGRRFAQSLLVFIHLISLMKFASEVSFVWVISPESMIKSFYLSINSVQTLQAPTRRTKLNFKKFRAKMFLIKVKFNSISLFLYNTLINNWETNSGRQQLSKFQ